MRRVRPRVWAGGLVVVYEAAPTMAIVGAFRVADVIHDRPPALWRRVGQLAGLTRREFDDYFAGAARGFGILVREAWTFPEAVPLKALRESLPGFHPPQGYRYLNRREIRAIGAPL